MNIKIISGSHLTTTNKKHIKALLNIELMEGKVNNLNYYINKLSDFVYIVNIPTITKSIITGKNETINNVTKFQLI
jgi:hypothetical protein